MASNKLSDNFLNELFKLCFRNSKVISILIEHLEYSYLPIEGYKKIWKAIKTEYSISETKKVPTIGMISQYFDRRVKKDQDAVELLEKIKEADVLEVDSAMESLEDFLKDAMAETFYYKFGETYSKGEKEKARGELNKFSEKLSTFSIKKGTKYYESIFGDFENRNKIRVINSKTSKFIHKIPFGIDEIDDITNGGKDVTDTTLVISRSGVGKTKCVRHMAVHSARRGNLVAHVQLEGSEQECLNGYDATWTACLMSDVKIGNIHNKTYQKLQKIVKDIRAKGSDIYVHAYEQFESASMFDIKLFVSDLIKIHGRIDDVYIDYLEKISHPGNGKRYGVNDEKQRREAIADKLKNIAVEYQTRVTVPTQASDVPPTLWNDPEWVIDRHYASNTKELTNSFSFVMSLNQTKDEYRDGMMRIYLDKLRHFKAGQTIKIYQNYRYDRFYDRMKTIENFY